MAWEAHGVAMSRRPRPSRLQWGVYGLAIDEELPDPVEIASDEAAFLAMFPDGSPRPADPRGAAWLWWKAVVQGSEFETAFCNLSTDRFLDEWSLDAAQREIEGLGFDSRLHRHGLSKAAIKFSPEYVHTVRAFAEFELGPSSRMVRLIRGRDGWWRVDYLGPIN